MAVAHYGCWTSRSDPRGKYVIRTKDARFARDLDGAEELAAAFYPFTKEVLGTASRLFQWMIKPLDPDFYAEGQEIWRNLPCDARISTSTDRDPDVDFLSLFVFGVNGYTQRHSDTKDISGGLAGLFSFGDYKGMDRPLISGRSDAT